MVLLIFENFICYILVVLFFSPNSFQYFSHFPSKQTYCTFSLLNILKRKKSKHTHTYTHTHILTHTDTHTHKNTCTQRHIYTHTHHSNLYVLVNLFLIQIILLKGLNNVPISVYYFSFHNVYHHLF